MHALIALENAYDRRAMTKFLAALGIRTTLAENGGFSAEAYMPRFNAFVCGVSNEREAAAQSSLWRQIQRQSSARGYAFTQRCFVLAPGAADHVIRAFGANSVQVFRTTAGHDVRDISSFFQLLRNRPVLTVRHVAGPYDSQCGACVPGEFVSPLLFRSSYHARPKPLKLFRFSRFTVDAIAKYATPEEPQDPRGIVELLHADPFYESLVSDHDVTNRNVITTWNRFRNELRRNFGDDLAESVARSEKVGRESFYAIDAEIEVCHQKAHSSDQSAQKVIE